MIKHDHVCHVHHTNHIWAVWLCMVYIRMFCGNDGHSDLFCAKTVEYDHNTMSWVRTNQFLFKLILFDHIEFTLTCPAINDLVWWRLGSLMSGSIKLISIDFAWSYWADFDHDIKMRSPMFLWAIHYHCMYNCHTICFLLILFHNYIYSIDATELIVTPSENTQSQKWWRNITKHENHLGLSSFPLGHPNLWSIRLCHLPLSLKGWILGCRWQDKWIQNIAQWW